MTKKRDRYRKRRDQEKKRRPFWKRDPRKAKLLWDFLCFGTIAVATLLVYHRATHYFFAQDDFTSLWIAREAPKTFWRVLSSFAYFRAVTSLFGLNPVAFHVTSLLFHMVNGVLVFLVARAFSVGRITSLMAATVFALHPALYFPIFAISSIGEILSCLFILLASLHLLTARKPEGLFAIPVVCFLFAASLLSKETTIAFPILAVFIFVARGIRLKKAVPLLVSLFAVAVAYATFFYLADIFDIKHAITHVLTTNEASSQSSPYAATLGPELITGLQTYFKWSFNIFEQWREIQFNILDKQALVWLVAGAIFFLVLIGRRGSHRVKSGYCVLWFLLMLLPVIPLTGHPYHYYLYIPLAGFCPALGISLARWLRRSRGDVLVSVCIIVLFLANSMLLMSKIERRTVSSSARLKDPVFDRALVSQALISDMRDLTLPTATKLVLISPLREIREGKIAEHPFLAMGGSYWNTNVQSAVAEGLGIRLFFPQVDTVAFADDFTPEFRDFFAIGYKWDGHLRFDTIRQPNP